MSAQAHVSRAHPERGMTYWDWSLQPIRDVEGKVSELVFSLADVTEKVRAESLLRVEEMRRARNEEELRRTATLLEKIYSNIYLNVAYLDPDFTILRVNQSFSDSVGRPPSSFIGRNHVRPLPGGGSQGRFPEGAGDGRAVLRVFLALRVPGPARTGGPPIGTGPAADPGNGRAGDRADLLHGGRHGKGAGAGAAPRKGGGGDPAGEGGGPGADGRRDRPRGAQSPHRAELLPCHRGTALRGQGRSWARGSGRSWRGRSLPPARRR